MRELLTVLPFLLSLVLYVGVLKLAALLYRRTRLGWWRGAAFMLIAIAVPAIVGLGVSASGVNLPFGLLAAAGLAVQLGLGGWFLGRFAATRDGVALGFARGALLAAIHWALMLVLTVPAFVLLTRFSSVGAS